MRQLFSEDTKYRLWRRIWVALATVEQRAGLVSQEELDDLVAHQDEIDIERIYEIERDTHHDVVAAIAEFAEKAPVGGKKIHLGATSMDINDNADALRVIQAMDLIQERLQAVLAALGQQIEKYADSPCLGYTHLQPAEPTTTGYRLAFYASELLADLEQLRQLRSGYAAKGMKGAIGTRASYTAILAGTKMSAAELDEGVMAELGLTAATITTQVVWRQPG
jgi:adenylosuccinate lyase